MERKENKTIKWRTEKMVGKMNQRQRIEGCETEKKGWENGRVED